MVWPPRCHGDGDEAVALDVIWCVDESESGSDRVRDIVELQGLATCKQVQIASCILVYQHGLIQSI